jgi:hypothetical protein
MDNDFIWTKLALEELAGLGYTEVWLGNVPNPHWEHGMGNGIVAAPKSNSEGWWPAVWGVSERIFGPMGCGNGLKEADQVQRSFVREMIPGHYVLKDGCWIPEESSGGW